MMNLIVLTILGLILLSSSAMAQESVPIEGRVVVPDGKKGRGLASIKVVLNGGEYSTVTRADGKFTFHDVEMGIYLLEVNAVQLAFPQMKVKVDDKSSISVVEYKFPGASRTPATHPIELMALTKLKYFHDPPRFSIIGMIMGNPMIILMAFSAGIIFLFPKMLSSMDPEAMKEFEKAQGEEDPMAAIKKMMGLEE
jgi:hypothetical protein